MKICLINPPFGFEDVMGETKSMGRVANIIPPLGLCYVASYLEKFGYEVSIIDGQLVDYENTLIRVEKERPDLIGMGATTPAFPNALKLAKDIKLKLPEVKIALGGNHVVNLHNKTLEHECFDYCILGEAEITFFNLVKALKTNGDLRKVKGIVFKENGKIVKIGKGEFIKNLDELPFPARHLIPHLKYYHPTPASYKKLPHADLITSRGCPYKCKFCDNGIFGTTYRERSAENVVEEVEEVVKKYGVKDIKFFDDIFTLNKERLYKILDLMKEKGIKVPWSCLTRTDLVDKEMLMRMKKAGCWQVLFGIEAGDQKMLDLLQKDTNVEQNERVIKWAHEAGLSVRADYLMGYPGDSLENMKNTLKFAIRMNTDFAHFNKFTPYPGNKFYEELVKKGYKFDFGKNVTQLDHSDTLYVPEGVDKEKYLKFINEAHKKYYLRLSYIWRQFWNIRSVYDVKRLYDGFMAIVGL